MRSKKRSPIKKRTLYFGKISMPVLSISMVFMIGIVSFLVYQYSHPAFFSTSLKSPIHVESDEVAQALTYPSVSNKEVLSETVHFEFYDTLPNMKKMAEEKKFVVENLPNPLPKATPPRANKMAIVNATDLERDLSNQIKKPLKQEEKGRKK